MALDQIDTDRDRRVVLVVFGALAASREGLWGISMTTGLPLGLPARNWGMFGA